MTSGEEVAKRIGVRTAFSSIRLFHKIWHSGYGHSVGLPQFMKSIFFALVTATSFLIVFLPRQVAGAQVTLILRNIETNDYNEWKLKPDQRFSKSTGKLGRDSAEFEQTWEAGRAGGNIQFWWARLNGEADATVLVDNIVVFQGHCMHAGGGSVRMIDTCTYPRVYKINGGGPYLQDKLESDGTHVLFATSMLLGRFGGAESLANVHRSTFSAL